jgi:superoxide reductase
VLTQNKVSGKTSTRIKNSTKPSFIQREPTFYHCSSCGQFHVSLNSGNPCATIQCCGSNLPALTAYSASDAQAEQHLPLMEISGGFESNTLTVKVGASPHPMETEHHLAWIYIYTFQGGQFKFLQPGDSPEAIFALSGKDAYVYCDRPVCKGNRCKFNCKRGFTAFSWCNQHGLWKCSF